MRIHSRKRVIETNNISIKVQSTGNIDALLLTAGKRDTTFSDLCHVTTLQYGKISKELCSLHTVPIMLSIPWLAKHNVFANCGVLNPCRLSTIGHSLGRPNNIACRPRHFANGTED